MNAAAAISLLVGVALMFMNVFFFLGIKSPTGAMEYKDFVSILLTAITVVVAVLAFGVALLAIWGYREFMLRAKEAAQQVANQQSAAFFKALLETERKKNQDNASGALSTMTDAEVDALLAPLDPLTIPKLPDGG